MSLLESSVSWQIYCFHSIQQRRGNCIEAIRSSDEENLAKINWDIDIMIGEGMILLGIKDLEHGCGRIAMEI